MIEAGDLVRVQKEHIEAQQANGRCWLVVETATHVWLDAALCAQGNERKWFPSHDRQSFHLSPRLPLTKRLCRVVLRCASCILQGLQLTSYFLQKAKGKPFAFVSLGT